jgi:hypothetical protein
MCQKAGIKSPSHKVARSASFHSPPGSNDTPVLGITALRLALSWLIKKPSLQPRVLLPDQVGSGIALISYYNRAACSRVAFSSYEDEVNQQATCMRLAR